MNFNLLTQEERLEKVRIVFGPTPTDPANELLLLKAVEYMLQICHGYSVDMTLVDTYLEKIKCAGVN